MSGDAAPTFSDVTETLLTAIDAHRADFERVSRTIHADPELPFAEHRASALLSSWLGEHGFTLTRPAGGLETSFVARHAGSRPGPTIAILMEYDALRGLGHGCGHNLIGAGGALAAILAADLSPDHPGTLLAIGTPAEEGGGGKIKLLDAGVFDEVDAALMFHPADRNLVARHGLAAEHLGVSFHGVAAHAAKNPQDGRSAAAAVQLFFVALDMLRQFIPTTARVHGIITNGGDAPNVVPALTEATFLVRDTTAEAVADLVARVMDAAEGAALATGCTAKVYETGPAYHERNNNLTLARRCAEHLAELGIDLEPPSPDNPAGSSDIGNLSRTIPIIHPYLQIMDRGTAGHSEAMRDAAVTPLAHERAALMAGALARTALDALGDPGLLATALTELADVIGGPIAPARAGRAETR
jgi:amidohydrolase